MGDDFIIDDYNSIIEDQDDYACNRFPILQDDYIINDCISTTILYIKNRLG